MPHENEMETEVIIIGKKKCPPIRKHFTSEEEALKWVRGTHCSAPCADNGFMVIGGDGDYEAIRFCK